MANIITVKFKPDGDKKLVQAINALSKAQKRLEGQNVKTGKSVKKVSDGMEKTAVASNKVATGMFKITNNGRLLSDQNKKVQHSFATIRSQLLLVSFGFGLVSGSVLRLVNLYAEQELAERRLTIALGHRSQALIDQASALQQQTRFGDEAIIGAQAMLAAFIKDEDQLKLATEATLDLASAKGMDLKSAADLVAKSIGSSTNSLTRYGVEAEGAAGSSKRLESITGNIKNLFGGFAKGELKTTRGMLDATSIAIGDAGENFGKVLLPPVLLVARALKLISESISIERIKGYGLAVTGLALAFNRAAIATAFFNSQLVISRAALIKSGYGLALIALGELASRFLFVAEATDESTKKTVTNTEELGRSDEEIQKNVDSLQKKLDLLILNADEMDRVAQFQQVLIEADGDLTAEEEMLHKKIIEIIISRKEATAAVKAHTAAIKEHESAIQEIVSWQNSMMDLYMKEAILKLELADMDKGFLEASNAKLEAVRALTSISQPLMDALGGELEIQAALIDQNDEWLTGQIEKLFLAEEITRAEYERAKAIIDILELQEKSIRKNGKEADSVDKLADAKEKAGNKMISIASKVNQEFNTNAESMRDIQFALAMIDAYKQYTATKLLLTEGDVPPIISHFIALAEASTSISYANKIRNEEFQYGGLVGGNRHSQGGTVIEAERGEFVMSRDAADSIGVGNLEAMNTGGGGGGVTVNIS